MAGNEGREARDDISRVSFDSIQEWNKIKENFSNAAVAALELKLGQRGLSGQWQIFLPHLEKFLDRTFELAKPNLRVNGRNFNPDDTEEPNMDQFDESLDRRVWALSDQRLKWDLEIALKRRSVPSEVEALMHDLIAQQREYGENIVDGADIDMALDDTTADDDNADIPKDLPGKALELQQAYSVQLDRASRAKQIDNEIRSFRA